MLYKKDIDALDKAAEKLCMSMLQVLMSETEDDVKIRQMLNRSAANAYLEQLDFCMNGAEENPVEDAVV